MRRNLDVILRRRKARLHADRSADNPRTWKPYLRLAVLAVIAASLFAYVNSAPPVGTSYDELKALGFPFKPEQPPLYGWDLIAVQDPETPLKVIVSLQPQYEGFPTHATAVRYWDWGDGFVSGAGGTKWHHTYDKPGVYEITVTVYSGGGCGIPTAIFEKTTTAVVIVTG